MDIIQSEAGQHLREELAHSPTKIIQSAFLAPVEGTAASVIPAVGTEAGAVSAGTGGLRATAESQFQGVALVSALIKLSPDWLFQNRAVFDALVRLWLSPARQARLVNEQSLSLNQASTLKCSSCLHNLIFCRVEETLCERPLSRVVQMCL